MKFLKNYLRGVFPLLVLSALILSNCKNSVSDDHDHEDPEGYVLRMNGSAIVTQNPEEDVTGEVTVAAGEETSLITIVYLDHDGDEIDLDDDYTIEVTFTADGIAEFEQHDEDGNWSFHIHGEAAGSTTMLITLMHGDHSHFTSQAIPVVVTE